MAQLQIGGKLLQTTINNSKNNLQEMCKLIRDILKIDKIIFQFIVNNNDDVFQK